MFRNMLRRPLSPPSRLAVRRYYDDRPPRPMLATAAALRSRLGSITNACLQPKLDGWRVIADLCTGRVFLRSGRELTTVNHIHHALRERPTTRFRYVDGELMHPDGRHYIHGCTHAQSRPADVLRLHIFDVVRSESDMPFSQRCTLLSEWLGSPQTDSALQLVPTRGLGQITLGTAFEHAAEAAEGYQKDGYEGAILRLDDADKDTGGCLISGNRSLNVIKYKTRQDDEFEILVLHETHKGSGLLGKVRC